MNLINLTPHAVNICGVTIQPSGVVARVAERSDVVNEVDVGGIRIPIVRRTFGDVTGLPPSQADTMYIVSALVAQAAGAAGRDDVVSPADFIRDEGGRVIGANALALG
jgi:hypothetical protein